MSAENGFNIQKIKDYFDCRSIIPRSRFAPSPTGLLHLGHAISAIYVWSLTRALGGQVVLRIEDHDLSRCRKPFEEAILRDLDWLGFAPDEGVCTVSQPSPFRQSDHLERYAQSEQLVRHRGHHIYGCDCSRKAILAHAQPEHGELKYPGHCRQRNLSPETPRGSRLQLQPKTVEFADLCLASQEQIPADQCGDLLIKDRNGHWTYQWAVTVDDFKENMSLIIRGEDLLSSTGRQILCGEMLGRERPADFFHHPLIVDQQGQKLSKRDGSTGIQELRASGYHPHSVLALAAQKVGMIRSNIKKINTKQLTDWFANEH